MSPDHIQFVIDRLGNFKFAHAYKAAERVGTISNHTMKSIKALADTYGDSGWFGEESNTQLIIDAAVAHIVQELDTAK